MSAQLSWKRDGERLTLQGELDQNGLNELWLVREQVMWGTALIDLSDITRVDSAGVALLVHLVDLAKRQGQPVHLAGVSDNLRTLAKLYNLPAGLLPGAD